LRPEQDWCSLCYARVEPAFDPLTAPLHEVVGQSESGAAPPEPVIAAEPAVVEVEPTAPVSDVDVMLSMLAAEHRQNDPAAGLAERFSDKSTRIVVMVGGMLVVCLVGFLALTILGAIF
jgi:hypothetical protein